MKLIFVACSRCGLAESATQKQPYCGNCEQNYRAERKREQEWRANNSACRDDDCELSHCNVCGVHSYIGQVCEECSW